MQAGPSTASATTNRPGIPIRVVVRIRPLSHEERVEGIDDAVQAEPKEKSVKVLSSGQNLHFAAVFGERDTESDIFSDSVATVLKNVFAGYNVSIVACGATGAGKSRVLGMDGSGQVVLNEGMLHLTLHDLFERIKENPDFRVQVTLSCVELVGKQQIHDLLGNPGASTPGGTASSPKATLRLLNSSGHFSVAGLVKCPVQNEDEALERVELAMHRRTTGDTPASRSHCIVTLEITTTFLKVSRSPRLSKVQFFDLASFDDIPKMSGKKKGFGFGNDVNVGLQEFHRVIKHLSDAKASAPPFHGSALTRLLQDSIGGTAYTIFIACISSGEDQIKQTLETLQLADQASKVYNQLEIHQAAPQEETEEETTSTEEERGARKFWRVRSAKRPRF